MKVSFIITVFNETEEEIIKSFDSMLNQTYDNIEIVVVLDNPNRIDLKKIIDNYVENNSNIIFIENKENMGLAKSLNIALKASTSEYIARLDADDYSELNRIEKQMQFMIDGNYDLVFCGRTNIDENEKIIDKSSFLNIRDKYINKLLKYDNCITHSSILVKKDSFKLINYYSEYKTTQDYDMYLKLVDKDMKFGELKEYLVFYKVRNNSISRKNRYENYLFGEYIRSNRELGAEKYVSNYLAKNDAYNPKKYMKINDAISQLNIGISFLKDKKICSFFKCVIIACFKSHIAFHIFIRMIRFQIVKKYYRWLSK